MNPMLITCLNYGLLIIELEWHDGCVWVVLEDDMFMINKLLLDYEYVNVIMILLNMYAWLLVGLIEYDLINWIVYLQLSYWDMYMWWYPYRMRRLNCTIGKLAYMHSFCMMSRYFKWALKYNRYFSSCSWLKYIWNKFSRN
jgi:hypothetical protein